MAVSEKRVITIISDKYPSIVGIIETSDGETAKSEVFVDCPTTRVSIMCGNPNWSVQEAREFVEKEIAKYEEAMDQMLNIRDRLSPALVNYASRLSRMDD